MSADRGEATRVAAHAGAFRLRKAQRRQLQHGGPDAGRRRSGVAAAAGLGNGPYAGCVRGSPVAGLWPGANGNACVHAVTNRLTMLVARERAL